MLNRSRGDLRRQLGDLSSAKPPPSADSVSVENKGQANTELADVGDLSEARPLIADGPGLAPHIDGHTPRDLTALSADLGLLEVPALIGPEGRFAVIHDRHHPMSGLLALMGWTDNLTDQGHALHMGKPGPELSTLQALFSGTPQVQIRVTENLSHLGESAFWEVAAPHLHRKTRSGGSAVRLPERFSALEDNP
ncbi:MAG: ParB-like protein, partial [Myxococcota bacterium]